MLSGIFVSLQGLLPEITLFSTVILILLTRLIFPRMVYSSHVWAVAGSILALGVAVATFEFGSTELFGGMLIKDGFGQYFRVLLLLFLALFTVGSCISGIPTPAFATEFYTLSFGSLLGMSLLTSANHILLVVVAFEMASLPSYALAGILKGDRKATEAALKFAIFGAGSAGIMLFGFSLLAGVSGAVHLPTMSYRLVEFFTDSSRLNSNFVPLVMGLLFVGAGIAFKLSLVPFHFWIADVFEGATAEVAGLLSVASKLAALAVFLRLLIAFGGPLASIQAPPKAVAGHAALTPTPSPEPNLSDRDPGPYRAASLLLGLIAAVSCTLGNFAAYPQQNIKRLMAYSTIAHAGYLAMGIAAVVSLPGAPLTHTSSALAALMFYSFAYLFMNLGVFTAVAFLRNRLGSEDISSYRGYGRQEPWAVVCLTIFLFNLIGLPPFAGFVAKFTVFAALADAGLWWLLIVGVLNTLISLFYYLRIARVMVFEPAERTVPAPSPTSSNLEIIMLTGLAVPLLIAGIWWDRIFHFCRLAAEELLRTSAL